MSSRICAFCSSKDVAWCWSRPRTWLPTETLVSLLVEEFRIEIHPITSERVATTPRLEANTELIMALRSSVESLTSPKDGDDAMAERRASKLLGLSAETTTSSRAFLISEDGISRMF